MKKRDNSENVNKVSSPEVDGKPLSKEELEDKEFLEKQRQSGKPVEGHNRGPGPGNRVAEKPKNAGKTIRRLLAYIGRSKYAVLGLLVMTIATTLLSLCAPAVQAYAIDALTGTADKPGVDFEQLYKMLALLLGVYLLSTAVQYVSSRLSVRLSQMTVFNMRRDLFNKISYLPVKFTDKYKHGDIMSRMTNDVDNISNSISQSISSLFSAVITIIGTLIIMFTISWKMTLISFITIPLTIISATIMAKFSRKLFVRQQRLLGSLNGHIEEMVSGYKTVMAFGREGEAIKGFGEINDGLRTTAIKANIVGGVMGPLMNVIGNINFLLIAVSGGYFALSGAISIGFIQSFIQYSKNFSRPINEIANQYTSIMTAIAGAERVFEIMDADVENDSDLPEIELSKVHGDIKFDDIMFSYKEGEPVLKHFDLDVKSGQKIAIVGRTGAGKTTIVNLLTRFYDIDSGHITLDGRDISEISRRSLRRAIAIVLQDTVLFSDTVKNNIRYGRLDASDSEIESAAATANADLFIERLPDGYQTLLTESGGNLSQGQRQLLAISRAVLADPKILILDEATSSVDTRTEMQIQSAMNRLMEGRTSLVIAHRLSTIRDADMIIVVDDGHIVEHGSHDLLLQQQGVYYNLYQTQFAGIET